jgi:type II secretory pathway component GspD/PulD (secretin)
MAKDGSTIIIGGLRKESEIETTKRVPLLASIPVLGKIFQDKTRVKTRTELVIILTPKLITGETMVTNVGIEGAGLEAIKSVKGYEDMPRQKVEAFPSEVYVPMDALPVPIKGPKGF